MRVQKGARRHAHVSSVRRGRTNRHGEALEQLHVRGGSTHLVVEVALHELVHVRVARTCLDGLQPPGQARLDASVLAAVGGQLALAELTARPALVERVSEEAPSFQCLLDDGEDRGALLGIHCGALPMTGNRPIIGGAALSRTRLQPASPSVGSRASAVQSLVESHCHGLPRLLADRGAHGCLDGELVGAVTERHERALERVPVDGPANLDEPPRAEEIRGAGMTT